MHCDDPTLVASRASAFPKAHVLDCSGKVIFEMAALGYVDFYGGVAVKWCSSSVNGLCLYHEAGICQRGFGLRK